VSKIDRDGWALFAEDAWIVVPDFTLTTTARLDHDSYFGYHVTPKLYGNWTIDESWALKGGVSAGYKSRICVRTTPASPACTARILIRKLVSVTMT
jgi:outer membrane receptor for ferrienterochelin and colicin